MSTTIEAAILARGRVTSANGGSVTFIPVDSTYTLHLASPNYSGPIGKPVKGIVQVTARKIWTVPSGGNFIAPIVGTPRTIQGRVRALDQGSMIVQAGVAVRVELPDADIVYDLANGPITVGAIVNVMASPGASFELR